MFNKGQFILGMSMWMYFSMRIFLHQLLQKSTFFGPIFGLKYGHLLLDEMFLVWIYLEKNQTTSRLENEIRDVGSSADFLAFC